MHYYVTNTTQDTLLEPRELFYLTPTLLLHILISDICRHRRRVLRARQHVSSAFVLFCFGQRARNMRYFVIFIFIYYILSLARSISMASLYLSLAISLCSLAAINQMSHKYAYRITEQSIN